jgi:hypothetical protein
MLTFNPAKRISVTEALCHPYLSALHSEEADAEPTCASSFSFEWERQEDTDTLRRDLETQIAAFHPDLARDAPMDCDSAAPP